LERGILQGVLGVGSITIRDGETLIARVRTGSSRNAGEDACGAAGYDGGVVHATVGRALRMGGDLECVLGELEKARTALQILADAIVREFGTFAGFREELAKAGATQFGSGWASLVLEDGALQVTKTANADLPLAQGQTACVTVDVREHAYHIDQRNARPKCIDTVIGSLLNWDFAAAAFSAWAILLPVPRRRSAAPVSLESGWSSAYDGG